MPAIKWIKISTNMFEDEKIRLIKSMPAGDTIIVIWLEMLLLAGRANESGRLLLTQTIPYNEEMLATLFNRQLPIVRYALETLMQFQIIEIDEDKTLGIKNWEKHQNTDAHEKIKEQNRLRKQKEREVKRLQAPEEALPVFFKGSGANEETHSENYENITKFRSENYENTDAHCLENSENTTKHHLENGKHLDFAQENSENTDEYFLKNVQNSIQYSAFNVENCQTESTSEYSDNLVQPLGDKESRLVKEGQRGVSESEICHVTSRSCHATDIDIDKEKNICAFDARPSVLKENSEKTPEMVFTPHERERIHPEGIKLRKKKPRNVYTEDFETFWAAYHLNQKDKKRAFEKFKQALKHYPFDVILTGAKNYMADCQKQGTENRFIKMAKTFLHNDSFLEYQQAEVDKPKPKRQLMMGIADQMQEKPE